MGKPKGIRTARKLKTHRQAQRWNDKGYKKAHLGTRWKANPFGAASHAKGIVLEKVFVLLRVIYFPTYALFWQVLPRTLCEEILSVRSFAYKCRLCGGLVCSE